MTESDDWNDRITGMLAVGVGEKCPFCEHIMIVNDDHVQTQHPTELVKALFPK